MARPRKPRRIAGRIKVTQFKPSGVSPASLRSVVLALEEWEAIRLRYAENLEQVESAMSMRISQSTFQRILDSANKKIGQALAEGKAIKIIQS